MANSPVAHVDGPALNNAQDFLYIGDIPRAGAEQCPNREALVWADTGRVTTYQQLEQQSSAFARYLKHSGYRAGQRIAYLGLNNDDFFSVLAGSIRAEVVLVPLNWRLTAQELNYQLADSGAQLLIHDAKLAETAAAACEGLPQSVAMMTVESELRDQLSAAGEPVAAPREYQQVVLQMYTSGTTGKPKGTLLTHGALSVARQAELEATEFSHLEMGCKTLSAMPNFHIGGMSWVLMGLVRLGTVVITADPMPSNMLKLLGESGARHSFIVPTVLRAMINELKDTQATPPEVDGIYYGAMPIGAGLLDELQAVFKCPLVQFFGMTENTGSATVLGPAEHDPARPQLLKSVGKPYPGMSLEIRDPDGRVVAPGTSGEIWVKSPTLMAGYWNLAEATAKAVVDGWYATGDGGYLDGEGYLFLTDRIKDMIVSGGENVYPAEVEEAIRGFVGVLDAAVVGVSDDKWGERVVAVVEAKRDAAINADELLTFCSSRLARYKCPKEVKFAPLPRTASGKVQRANIRKDYASY